LDDYLRAAEDLVRRAHDAGVLRADVGAVDIALLVEHARRRIIAVALDGLRTPAPAPLPDPQPGWELFTDRWTSSNSPSTP